MPHRFATALTCIDGRIQRPVQDWARDHLGVDYLDVITEPGPDSVVATIDQPGLGALLRKVAVSRHAHGSTTLLLAGHADCAANPATDDEHHQQLRQAAGRLAGNLPGTRVVAVHATQCGQDCWRLQVVAEAAGRARRRCR